MKKRETSWTKKLVGIAGAFGLTFAMACASTPADDMSHDAKSDEVAVGETTDPVGPPQHIATRPLTNEHPSSNTGYGNADASGANTNLNRPVTETEAVVHESDAVVTQTPIVEEEAVVVTETEPVVEETAVIVETEPVEVETTVVETEPVQTAEVTTMSDTEEDEVETRRVTKKE